MLSIDWRARAAYGHTNVIPPSGFSWEYLRRNDEYRRDCQTLAQPRAKDVAQLESFTHHWGVLFPQ